MPSQDIYGGRMSLFVLRLPGLAFGPAFKMKDGQLRSRSSLLFCAATLGLYFKRVVVDPQAKAVRITPRFLWFFSCQREIPFVHIKRIDYSHKETLWTGDSSRALLRDDTFTVSLILHDDSQRIRLWSFFGPGSGETLFSDSGADGPLIDLEGSQEEDSLYFVELLQYFTGKPLTRCG